MKDHHAHDCAIRLVGYLVLRQFHDSWARCETPGGWIKNAPPFSAEAAARIESWHALLDELVVSIEDRGVDPGWSAWCAGQTDWIRRESAPGNWAYPHSDGYGSLRTRLEADPRYADRFETACFFIPLRPNETWPDDPVATELTRLACREAVEQRLDYLALPIVPPPPDDPDAAPAPAPTIRATLRISRPGRELVHAVPLRQDAQPIRVPDPESSLRPRGYTIHPHYDHDPIHLVARDSLDLPPPWRGTCLPSDEILGAYARAHATDAEALITRLRDEHAPRVERMS